MKSAFKYLFAVIGLSFWCGQNVSAGGEGLTVASVSEYEFDFGTVSIKEKDLEHRFIVKNESDESLVISNVRTYCGCVNAGWTKTPVAPGDTGSVVVVYANNKSGKFRNKAKLFFKTPSKSESVNVVLKGVCVKPKRGENVRAESTAR